MKTFFRAMSLRQGVAAGLCVALVGFASPALARERSSHKKIDFVIEDGGVTPTESFAAKVTVLGAAIQLASNEYTPVTAKLVIGDEEIEPFGSYDDPTEGNVSIGGAKSNIVWTMFDAGSSICVQGKSWQSLESSNGRLHMTADSRDNSAQVKVLRNGDPVPNIEGYGSQSDVESFLEGYFDFDTGKVTLGENEAIYLFELGTTDMGSDAADFQDLVVVVELGESPEALAGATDEQAMYD